MPRRRTVTAMNENHALCASTEWAEYLCDEVLQPLAGELDLGAEMLEIGPGPGAATEWLRRRVRRLVALEVDPDAAERLSSRFAGTNVEVVIGDACCLQFDDSSFDSVGTFTMLHHLPTVAGQNRVLNEAFRVLRPGGVLAGSDSVASAGLHDFHAGDVYNPIEPSALLTRLQTIGFSPVTVSVGDDLRFVARRPLRSEA